MLFSALQSLATSGVNVGRLLEINLALNATLDLQALLDLIIEGTKEMLDCEEASILLYDEGRGHLVFVSASGTSAAQLAAMPVPLADSIAGTIFRENRPVITRNAAADERHYNAVGEAIGFTTRSLLGVPMSIEGVPVGVLEALNKRTGSFSEADTDLLTVLAAQAAVAIRNARQSSALNAAYEAVERADRMKTNLVGIASHELRTPLNAILGFAGALDEMVEGEAKEFAGEVTDAARRMQGVIEAMTELMDVLSAAMPLVPVNLGDVVRSAVPADDARLVLTLPEAPVQISGVASQLRVAVRNLIENAATFSPPDSPIYVRIVEAPGEAVIEVQDTGIGLAEEHLAQVFEPFFQVEHYLTRTHGGLGIGLTQVREVALRHGGTTEAASEGPGTGTTIRLRLPRA